MGECEPPLGSGNLPSAAVLSGVHKETCVSLQPLELICEKAIATCNRPLGAGEALRRVMECLASGILLQGTHPPGAGVGVGVGGGGGWGV